MRGLFGLFLIIAVLLVMYNIRYYVNSHEVEKSSSLFVSEAVAAIGNNWDAEEFEKRANGSKAATVAASFAGYRKLGGLKSPPYCAMRDFTTSEYKEEKVQYISASYECKAEFANGPATLQLTVYSFVDSTGYALWKIQYFNVISPTFLPPLKR